MEFSYRKPPCGSDEPKPPEWWYRAVDDIHYLHFGVILWLITGIVAILISLLTEEIPEENLYRLTFWSRRDERVRVDLDAGDEIAKDEPEEQKQAGEYEQSNAKNYK